MNTVLSIQGEKFLINGKLTYSEIPNCNPKYHGLLMNARFIQGVFDSKNEGRFDRFGKKFDPMQNTQELIDALPAWYAKGLRAIVVGMQGGGPCFTCKWGDIQNNPYSADGTQIDSDYLHRLNMIISACDKLGMVVVVNYFYGAGTALLSDAQAVINVTKKMSTYLKDTGYKNLIIDVVNEYNIGGFAKFPLINESQGVVALLEIAKTYAGGILVGCSGGGAHTNKEVCEASDVVIIHGNGESRGHLYNHILKARSFSPNKPVIIDEDSQAVGQLKVCEELAMSWGYYNNMTKQEPPTDWGITKGEDEFFAWRMADMLGIEQAEIPQSEQYYLQGVSEPQHESGIRFIRLASLYPEKIDFVRFYKNEELVYTAYDECFMINYHSNWLQDGLQTTTGDIIKAQVVLRDGSEIVLEQTVLND